MPIISVIMPAYNCEKYIAAALDSVTSQTFFDFEVIAVDDGSTDSTGSIIDLYSQKDSRIRAFHRCNSGVAASRSFALTQACGEWLAFCDADDTIPPNAYADMLDVSDNADIVIGSFYDIDDFNKKTFFDAVNRTYDNVCVMLLSVVCLWNKLIRREFIIKHSVDFENVILGEDAIFLSQLATHSPRCALVRSPVYYHWYHNNSGQTSLVHRYTLEMFQCHLYCRERMAELLGEQVQKLVYGDMTEYLVEFLSKMSKAERDISFLAFKEFVLKHDWKTNDFAFRAYYNMTPQQFSKAEADEFLLKITRRSKIKKCYWRFMSGEWTILSLICYTVNYVIRFFRQKSLN